MPRVTTVEHMVNQKGRQLLWLRHMSDIDLNVWVDAKHEKVTEE